MKKNKLYPLISVIITDYNYGQYVAQAIDSVLTQTYPNIELIIINDGSTDDSDSIIRKAIAKKTKHEIKYIHRKNKGIVITRNEGIKLAKGKYFCFLDADDYFNPDFVENNYSVAVKYDADVVFTNWHYTGEWLGLPDTNFQEFDPKLLQLQKIHCHPASLVKKSAIKDHRFEVEEVAEDWDFFLGLSLDGLKFKLAKNNYLNYRIRKGTRGSKNTPEEDTKYFVEILSKYKKKYGDKVIDPEKLVALRHPNAFRKMLRWPSIVVMSIKQDGAIKTIKKIIKKIVARSQVFWKILRFFRNKKYNKAIGSFVVKKSPDVRLAVILHLYYPDLWPVIKKNLQNINVPFDLFVSVQPQNKEIALGKVNKFHMNTNIISLPNRGRDTLPFLMIARKIYNEGQYEYLLKLHSKKSLHRDDGSEWLKSLLHELIPKNISSVVATLEKPSTGAIGPAEHVVSLSRYMGANKDRVEVLLKIISNEKVTEKILLQPEKYPFFGGTMFWCRLDFLAPLLEADSDITPGDFGSEKGQIDGTTAHAVERIIGKSLHEIAHKKMYTIKDGVVTLLPNKDYSDKYIYVERP